MCQHSTVVPETIAKCCTKTKKTISKHCVDHFESCAGTNLAATVMNTFAVCDEASTTTLFDAAFAEQIGADGPELPFCCHWMNKITTNYKKSKKVPFKIAGVGSESKWHVVSGAVTIQNLDLPRQTIDLDFLMRKYPYLPRDVLDKVTSVKPRVLIG
jgi:hypothetical protein